jgi:hypothetical protein
MKESNKGKWSEQDKTKKRGTHERGHLTTRVLFFLLYRSTVNSDYLELPAPPSSLLSGTDSYFSVILTPSSTFSCRLRLSLKPQPQINTLLLFYCPLTTREEKGRSTGEPLCEDVLATLYTCRSV